MTDDNSLTMAQLHKMKAQMIGRTNWREVARINRMIEFRDRADKKSLVTEK
jgi:hypothetical protein